jgi:hypothetical protein
MAIVQPRRHVPARRPWAVTVCAVVLVVEALVSLPSFAVLAVGYGVWHGHVHAPNLGAGLADGLLGLLFAVGATGVWRGSGFWRAIAVGCSGLDLLAWAAGTVLPVWPVRGGAIAVADALVLGLLLLPPSSRRFFRRE